MLKRFVTETLVLAALLLFVPGPGDARTPDDEPGVWIVELSDPPTTQFRGGTVQGLTSSGTGEVKAMAATSPLVTGEPKLRIQSPEVREYVAYLDERRANVLYQASGKLGRALQPRWVYRHALNGFAVELSAGEAARLRALPGVRSVTREVVQYLQTDAGPQWINAPEMWSGSTGAPNPNQGEGTVLGVIDSGVNWDSIFFDVSQPGVPPVTNPRPGFLGLCADGTLPDACNAKLIGIYDFTDEGSNGFDPDGHGSHVASTAVGLPLSFNLDFGSGNIPFSTSGVAPRASFIMYKACQAPDDGSGGFTCPGSATTAAIEQAITDGVDAVNFSIGGPPFDPWSLQGNQRAFLNMRIAGVVPVTSAGNDGPNEFTVGSPANVPWALSVANATHGRILANRLVDVTGGPFALGTLAGEGISQGTAGTRPIVHARDFGNALCGIGTAELAPDCAGNTGATNPFPPGTFNGEIVVCDRGVYGRVEKGKNLLLAGAGGMILANTDDQGESTAADEHCLPATHVGDTTGDRLRDWLASGSGHRGRLTGTARFVDPDRAGRLNSSSSRGPSFGAPDVMKPNVTAPGTNVLAAGTQINATGDGPGADAANQILFLTGTSMSSPHVAGATLLLRKAHPDWGVDQVISALETTAAPGIVTNGDGSTARVIDRGAGGIQVDQAARIGLYLATSEQAFLNANPALGGDPGALNLPGVFSDNCVGSCSFTRTVTALGNGSWAVTTEGELEISATPSSFTLNAGQTRQIQITIEPGTARIGDFGAGAVVLTPTSGDFSTQRLPVGAKVSAGVVPAPLAIQGDGNRGRDQITFPELIPIDELVIRTSPLVRPEQRAPRLARDSTNGDPFDGGSGVITELLEVPADALLLHAETFTSPANDIDLFVGRDLNGDGLASEDEQVCESRSGDDTELCDVNQPQAGTWWILVQNWEDSGQLGARDEAPFEFAVLSESTDPSLVSFGPGKHSGGPLTVPVYWDQPAMQRDERWLGVVAASTSPDELANIGSVAVSVTRTGVNAPAETALFNGQTQPVVVPGGTSHELLYFDVPPSVTRLDVDVQGTIGNVRIARRPFEELVASIPATPPAPAATLVQATESGNGWSAVIDGNVQAGRYFVVLENTDAVERRVEVTVTAQEGTAITARRGLWGPAARAISQGMDWQQGGGGRFGVWYTYDEDGAPTFYITDTVPVTSESSFFKAALFRATSDDQRLKLNSVGTAQVTAIGQDRFMFAWQLNGFHGAEMFRPVAGTSCPTVDGQVQPLLGHWFSPGVPSGGATLLITDGTEAWIRYYYDDSDTPRWVLADTPVADSGALGGGLEEVMEVLDFRGFCIYCDVAPVSNEVVGLLGRDFSAGPTVREVTDVVAGPPIDSSLTNDRPLSMISSPLSCPNS